MVENENFKKIMNVPFSVIIASFVIIVITSNMIDRNALSALIGGYSGLLLGLFFIIILNLLYDESSSYLDIFPIVLILMVLSLLIYYLSTYFDKISIGEVSSYYYSFLTLSTIFLAAEMSIISSSIYNKTQDMSIKLFSNTNFSLLILFGLINS